MVEIDQRQLGATGLTVPALGVGVWSWGDKSIWGYGKSYTEQDLKQAYTACLDAGLNFFDTAEIYGGGESERILGRLSQNDHRPIIVASKFAPLPTRLAPQALLDALDKSLERLGAKSIDLYQIHWPNPLAQQDRYWDALGEAVRAGKVRAVGVSNYNEGLLRKAYARLARHGIPLASNQVHYSLLHRKPEVNGVLSACRELNVTLIAYSPLAQGLLTGKYREGASTLSWQRRLLRNYSTRTLQKIEPLLTLMGKIALKHDRTMAQVALNWLLCQDECIIPIPGAKNVRQALENAGALGWRLTEEEHGLISRAAQPWLR